MKRLLLATSLITSISVVLVGCSTNPAPAPASSSAGASSSSALSSSAEASPGQSQPAAYIETNCGITPYNAKKDSAPTGEDELNGVYVKADPKNVPVVTVAPDLPPATELATLDIVQGTGAVVKAGDKITFDYCGIGQSTQGMFDSSWLRGEPISYPLTKLIPGWQEGIPGMKVGGRRLLIVPGPLAYGENPPPGIEPNETLIFVVDVKSIDK